MVLIKSATHRLKMNKFVTVLIFLFSDINKILNVFFSLNLFLRITIQRTAQFPRTAVMIIKLKQKFQKTSSL